MKLGFTFKDVKMENVQIGEVTINTQYTAEELITEYDLFRKIIKDIPELINDLEIGMKAYHKADKNIEVFLNDLDNNTNQDNNKTTDEVEAVETIDELCVTDCTDIINSKLQNKNNYIHKSETQSKTENNYIHKPKTQDINNKAVNNEDKKILEALKNNTPLAELIKKTVLINKENNN